MADEFEKLLEEFHGRMVEKAERLTSTHERDLQELNNLKINLIRNAKRQRRTEFWFS